MRDACRRELILCGKKAICLCRHGKLPEKLNDLSEALVNIKLDNNGQYRRYLQWSMENLKLEAGRRNISLPDKDTMRTRLQLMQRLLESDPQYPFRLMDLPIEIRRRIYSMVLCSNENENGDTSTIRTSKTALLRTSRQVRLEASSVFYSNPYFRFKLELHPVNGEPEECFAHDQYPWLESIGPQNVQMLRRVSFYFFGLHNEYNIHINLTETTGAAWRITTSYTVSCPCRRLETRSLMQLREHFGSDSIPEPKKHILDTIDQGIEAANRAVSEFRILCHSPAGIKTTVEGLKILAKAARSILLLSTEWHQRLAESKTKHN
jgi:hypothetical protein